MHHPRLVVLLLLAPLGAQSPQANSHIAVRGTFDPHPGQTYTALTGFTENGTDYAVITTQKNTTLIKVPNPDGPFYSHNQGYTGPDDWKEVVVVDTNVGRYTATVAGSNGDQLTGFIRFTKISGDNLSTFADWAGGAATVTTPHAIAVSPDNQALGVCDPNGGQEIVYQINPGALPQTNPHNPALAQVFPHAASHNVIRNGRLTSIVVIANQFYEIAVHDGATLVSNTFFQGAGIPHGLATLENGTLALVASVTPNGPNDTYKLTGVPAVGGGMIPLPNTWETGPSASDAHVTRVHVRGDIAYVAYGTVGFRAYDISAFPAVPPAIMSYDNPIVGGTPDELVDIYPQPSGVIYALYERSGFRVLQPALDVISYGVGTAGTGGAVPVLSAPTPPYIGGTFTYAVSNALPSTVGLFLLGTTPTALPILGITLLVHPSSWVITPSFFLSGSGTAAMPVAIPNNITLLSLTLCNQGVIVDAGGPSGFSATQGLRLD